MTQSNQSTSEKIRTIRIRCTKINQHLYTQYTSEKIRTIRQYAGSTASFLIVRIDTTSTASFLIVRIDTTQ